MKEERDEEINREEIRPEKREKESESEERVVFSLKLLLTSNN